MAKQGAKDLSGSMIKRGTAKGIMAEGEEEYGSEGKQKQAAAIALSGDLGTAAAMRLPQDPQTRLAALLVKRGSATGEEAAKLDTLINKYSDGLYQLKYYEGLADYRFKAALMKASGGGGGGGGKKDSLKRRIEDLNIRRATETNPEEISKINKELKSLYQSVSEYKAAEAKPGQEFAKGLLDLKGEGAITPDQQAIAANINYGDPLSIQQGFAAIGNSKAGKALIQATADKVIPLLKEEPPKSFNHGSMLQFIELDKEKTWAGTLVKTNARIEKICKDNNVAPETAILIQQQVANRLIGFETQGISPEDALLAKDKDLGNVIVLTKNRNLTAKEYEQELIDAKHHLDMQKSGQLPTGDLGTKTPTPVSDKLSPTVQTAGPLEKSAPPGAVGTQKFEKGTFYVDKDGKILGKVK